MKFKFIKRLPLDFLGNGQDAWKDAYLEMEGFTIRDLRDKISKLSDTKADDTKSITKGIDGVVELVKERFISGKAPDKSGELVAISKEDIEDLPAEVINKLVSFLSQSVTESK